MIRKAVIPAAGLGTRFLPATKAQPKEMLPIIDTPTIQYVVQEAIDAGIDDILIISGKGKRALEDHFDRMTELEHLLKNKEEKSYYHEIRRIGEMANIHYIRQKELKGLGDAIRYAHQHTADEPFMVLLGDTVIDAEVPVSKQLIEAYKQYRQTVIAVEEVPPERIHRYGIIGGKQIDHRIWQVNDLVEKPAPDRAPSHLAIAGCYILTPEIFNAVERTKPGLNNEIQLTDAIKELLQKEKVYACQIEGRRYDIGTKLDYLKLTVEFGLKRDEFRTEFAEFLRRKIDELK
jgi:UTP--glucose-1-phosphate uridylyltransferase